MPKVAVRIVVESNYLMTVLLAAIGLVMAFSSSAMTSFTKYHNMWYFELRQVTWASAGLFFLFFFIWLFCGGGS
ncbi:hypothetical protein QJ48_17940 [Paenibacillus sp. A3]|nr:hypothetical protein QJ48_17940 [Paenibacillus sp. A3]